MQQGFFTNTIESKFIKSLIYNTPIPIMDSVSDGDYLVEGLDYITRNGLVHCTRSGYLYTGRNPSITVDSLKVGENLFTQSGTEFADYTVTSPYVLGDDIPQMTEKFVSKFHYYDPTTHKHLGKLLRCMRDIWGINLMPFYNCVNYTLLNDVHLTNDSSGYVIEETSDYKVFAVPIKFNKEYTIALDSDSRVLMKSVIHGELGMVRNSSTGRYFTDELKENNKENYFSYTSTSFHKPIYYKISNTMNEARSRVGSSPESTVKNLQLFQNLQDDLYLLIQVAKTNNSSLVVLEGHWESFDDVRTRHLYSTHYIPFEEFIYNIDSYTDNQINEQLISNLSLLKSNDKKITAFSNKLIEYLLLNVIDSHDEIDGNVEKVQTYTDIRLTTGERITYFNSKMRAYLFFEYFGYDTHHADISKQNIDLYDMDINGFVDKRIEKFITRGYNV